MLPGGLFLWIALGAAALLAAVAVGLVLARRNAIPSLDDAWRLLENQPSRALGLFQRAVPHNPKKLLKWRKAHPEQALQAYLGLAVCLIRLGRVHEAEKALVDARALGPLSPDDHAQLCRAYLSTPDGRIPDSAVRELAALLASDGDPQLRARAEEALKRRLTVPHRAGADPGYSRRTADLAQQVIAAAPNSAWAHAGLGIALAELGQAQQAVGPLEQAVQLDPKHVEAHLALGRIYRELGDWRRSFESFLCGARLAPGLEPAIETAKAARAWSEHLDSSDPRRQTALLSAIEVLAAAAQANPAQDGPWLILADIYRLLGRHAESLDAIERAIAASPASAEAHASLGEYWFAHNQPEKGRAMLARAVELQPTLPGALRRLGDLDYAKRDYAGARTWYARLYQQGETDDEIAYRLAFSLFQLNEHEELIQVLGSRHALTPECRLLLGRSLARKGRWPEALAALDTGDVDSREAEYRYYLAAARGQNRRLVEAEALLVPLLDDPHWCTRAGRQLAHVKLLQGELAKARELYVRCSGGSVAFDLGRLALTEGDSQQALGHFEGVLAKRPDHAAAQFGLAYCRAELGDAEALNKLATSAPRLAAESAGDRAFQERRYLDAAVAYERAQHYSATISTATLARMAVAYLQLHRDRDALTQLVELHKRCPEDANVRYNLAVCRFQLGRTYFSRSQWDAARKQFQQAESLLRTVAPEQAAAVLSWELEAGYREAARILQNEATVAARLKRAKELFESGEKRAPNDGRWSLGVGLIKALKNDFAGSAVAIARAVKTLPNDPSVLLALALSMENAGKGDVARQALGQALSLLEAAGAATESDRLSVAARFAMVMSFARGRQWREAAAEMERLLEHPLVRRFKQFTPTDVAQAAVAYFAAAGDKEGANRIAQRHLTGATALNAVLVGLMQADAGDYEGAVQTLEAAYAKDRNPGVARVIAECLLAAAAAAVKSEDLAKAAPLVEKALRYNPENQQAQGLRNAIAFALNLGKLDMSQLDRAIAQVEPMFTRGERSPQVLRSLAALYHRQAAHLEASGRAKDQTWSKCVEFWKTHILNSADFWTKFLDAYNAGKGRRERLQPDDLQAWRETLAEDMSGIHVRYVGEYMKISSLGGVQRHLNLIWEWAPDFKPPDNFLVDQIGTVDDSLAEMLENVLPSIKQPSVREAIATVPAVYWCNKGIAIANAASDLFVRVMEVIKSQGAAVLQYMRSEILSNLRTARSQLAEAKNLVGKAKRLAPSNAKIREQYAEIDKVYDIVREVCGKVGL